MSEKKIIGLFGTGQTDICLYVASILQNMGQKVYVADNSYEQAMHYCIPHPEEKLATITYRKIDYERMVSPQSLEEKSYDYLIVDLGVWPLEETLQLCSEIYLVMDCSVALVERYRELMKRLAIPMNVILRDVCPDAVSTKRILSLLCEENCFLVDTYVLPLAEEDVAGRLGMQYQGYRNFLQLSLPFEKMLVRMCRQMAECEISVIWRSFRHARKGECA